MIGKLDTNQVNNLLCSQSIGRLACTDGEQPYIVPISFSYDGVYIYGQTNMGKKLKIIKKNPDVCFEVDQMMDMRNWQSVVIYGEFEELKNKAAGTGREILFEKEFSLLTNISVHAHEHAVTSILEDKGRIKEILFRIKIKKVTGRYQNEL
jgi:nitroimidazol reductase NimA-like FMN-containing flavoprotein (pyridoxamine 5'-phosphate oxidase superfamily)